MNDLFSPANDPVSLLPYKLPYLANGKYLYDRHGFAGYPSRNGFILDKLTTGDFNGKKEHDICAFLQEWLWMGLAFEVFDVVLPDMIENTTFIKERENCQYISTRELEKMAMYWVARNFKANKATQEENLEKIEVVLWKAYDVINMMLSLPIDFEANYAKVGSVNNDSTDRDSLGIYQVLLSAVLLGERLCGIKDYIYRDSSSPISWQHKIHEKRLMLDKGWCPVDIGRASSTGGGFSLSMMCYLSARLDDYKQEGIDHSSCSESLCCIDAIAPNENVTRHFLKSCKQATCHHLNAGVRGMDHICQVLRNDRIPLITVQDLDTERTSITVLQANSVTKSNRKDHFPRSTTTYVAFSHVWSEGLGNAVSKSPPLCQIERLQKIANELYPETIWPVPFWIDTLCVPLDPQYRRKAIQMMAKTYEKADKVLVIDNFILKSKISTPIEELLTRIKYARWTCRLWTYQEGALANKLYFQLFNVAIQAEDLIQQHEKKFYHQLDNFISGEIDLHKTDDKAIRQDVLIIANGLDDNIPSKWRDEDLSINLTQEDSISLGSQLHSITLDPIFSTGTRNYQQVRKIKGLSTKKNMASAIEFALEELRWRSTSRAEDESICLASLLGVSIAAVIEDLGEDVGADRKVIQARRMKRLFSLVPEVPAGIFFLAVPRIHIPGYRWVPMSFLQVFESTYTRCPNASATPNGFCVTLPGLMLDCKQEELAGKYYLILDIQNIGRFEVYLERRTMEGQAENEITQWSEFHFTSGTKLALIFPGEIKDRHDLLNAILVMSKIRENIIYAEFKATVFLGRLGRKDEGYRVRVNEEDILTGTLTMRTWCIS